MTQVRLKPFAVVVGVTPRPRTDYAIVEALHTAATIGDAAVHVVHVIDSHVAGEPPSLEPAARALLARVTRIGVKLGLNAPAVDVMVHVRVGDPADVILKVAEARDAELIVLGASRTRELGPVSRAVLEGAGCQVRIAPAPRPWLRVRRRGPEDRETHVYELTQRVSFVTHDSDVAGPTGVPMI